MKLFRTGGWSALADTAGEDRSLPAPDVRQGLNGSTSGVWDTNWYPPQLNVNTGNALTITDAFACIKLLSDSASSLPLKVYRRLPQGRVPAGPDSRAVQLLQRPSPGSTGIDLISQTMVHLNLFGECFVGLYRADGEIVQLGLIHPDSVQVELRGQRAVYTLDTLHGRVEVGPEDVLHIKGLSVDGLRGMSPVKQCRVALGLSGSLQQSSKEFFAHGSRPSGILTAADTANSDALSALSEAWSAKHGGVSNMHRVAVLSGDIKFQPLGFSNEDAQALQSREFSVREVARAFGVPAHLIGGATGDSLTYSNASQLNRHFLDYGLMPWLRRIETALSNSPELCPGSTYCQFDVRGFLRPDPDTRSQIYERALNGGWLQVSEIRELEDLTPLPEESSQ